MKPKRSVEHVVTDLFAFLGTYDCRDERRILALDAKGPQAFRTFYASYLPLIVTLWTQALQYDQPRHAERVTRAFLDEVTARLYRMGAHGLAEDVLRGVAGLPGLLQRENGVVLVAAACVESMTGGNISKKGKRANLLTQKILKILQFFINKLAMFEIVETSPVRAPYVSMFFTSSDGNGTQPEPPASVPPAPQKPARTAAAEKPAVPKKEVARERPLPRPETPVIPEPEETPVWATETEPPESSAPPEPAPAEAAPPARRELPPEPLTSDEPPLEEIEEVWAENGGDEEEGAETARTGEGDAIQAEIEMAEPEPEPAPKPKVSAKVVQPVEVEPMDSFPEDMGDSFYDDDDDEMIVVEADEADELVLGDDIWAEADEDDDEDIGAGDPYNELGMSDAPSGADSDFSGFEFEETGDEDKIDRGIDVDEFHDVINQVVTEVLASQDDSSDPEPRA